MFKKAVRRLQEYFSHCKRACGGNYVMAATIVRIDFLLDSDGNIIKYTNPTHISLEGRNDDFDSLIRSIMDSCS